MGDLHKVLSELCDQKKITAYKMCKDVGMQPSVMTDLKMGRRSSIKAETADRLATYFGVSVGYLLGNEKKAPIQKQEPSEEDIKFALFKGDKEISDEAYEEVKAFAEFVKQKYKRGKE